jgi:hypothetical protein
MEHFWEQVVDNAQQRCGQVSADFPWPVAARQHHLEEPGRRYEVEALRHQHVNDLAMLVDRSAHVPPHPGNLHIGFIDEPAVTDTVPGRPRCVDDQRGETLHPPVDGDVINVDAAFGEELSDISVRQAVAEVPPDGQQDHVRREPESGKRRRSKVVRATTNHPRTLRPRPTRQRNSATRRTCRISGEYFTMQIKARTPSFQPIFLPSSYPRPA